jgi:hypothetical protein
MSSGADHHRMSNALQAASRAALLNVAHRVVLRPRLSTWGATDVVSS